MKKVSTVHAWIFICLLAFWVVSSCGNNGPLTMGFIGGLSGGNADLGEAGRNGAIMAVEKINSEGGINGRQVQLSIKDDGNESTKAIQAAKELVQEKVAVIIGPFSTTMTEAAISVTEPEKLLVISPTASAIHLADRDDYLVRINSSTRVNAQNYAQFMFERRGYTRVTAAADDQNRSFTQSWFEEFSKAFKNMGGQILSITYFNSKSLTGYNTLVQTLLTDSPDAILLIANSVDSARLAQQIRKENQTIPMVPSEWAGTQQLIELGGKSVDGMEFLQNVNFYSTEEPFLKFQSAYKERFGKPAGFSSVMAYSSVMVAAQALTKKQESQSLKEAVLANSPYMGLQQKIDFNRFGDTRRTPVFVTVKGTEFTLAAQ